MDWSITNISNFETDNKKQSTNLQPFITDMSHPLYIQSTLTQQTSKRSASIMFSLQDRILHNKQTKNHQKQAFPSLGRQNNNLIRQIYSQRIWSCWHSYSSVWVQNLYQMLHENPESLEWLLYFETIYHTNNLPYQYHTNNLPYQHYTNTILTIYHTSTILTIYHTNTIPTPYEQSSIPTPYIRC